MSKFRCFFCGHVMKDRVTSKKTGQVAYDFLGLIMYSPKTTDPEVSYRDYKILERDGMYYYPRDLVKRFCIVNGYYLTSLQNKCGTFLLSPSVKIKLSKGPKIKFWCLDKKKLDQMKKKELEMKRNQIKKRSNQQNQQ